MSKARGPTKTNEIALTSFDAPEQLLFHEAQADRSGRLVAVVVRREPPDDPSHVEVWDTKAWKRISRFVAAWSIGGSRLAISPDGQWVATADYSRGCIGLYESRTGQVVWQLKRLQSCQRISFDREGKHVLACFDIKPLSVLRVSDGTCVMARPGSTDARYDPASDYWVELARKLNLRQKAKVVAEFDGAWLGSVVFSKRHVFINRYNASLGVACYKLQNGLMRWACRVPKSEHNFGSLWYEERKKSLFAVQNCRLLRLDEEDGVCTEIARGFKWNFNTVFCDRGSKLILGNGLVISTSTGKPLRRIPIGE